MNKRAGTIAITGSIGAGKSLLGKLLQARGYKVIDTDQVVHDLFATSDELKARIVDRFGKSVLNKENKIDRSALGKIVFQDEKARADLEAIVHPATIKECEQLLDKLTNEKFVFFLVPLLFEANLQDRFQEVWSIICDEPVLRERLKLRNGYSDKEISDRLAAQIPQDEKSFRSNRIINNSKDVGTTEKQLETILKELNVGVHH